MERTSICLSLTAVTYSSSSVSTKFWLFLRPPSDSVEVAGAFSPWPFDLSIARCSCSRWSFSSSTSLSLSLSSYIYFFYWSLISLKACISSLFSLCYIPPTSTFTMLLKKLPLVTSCSPRLSCKNLRYSKSV